HLEAHGFRVVCSDNLKGVTNIYDETPERAYQLARSVDRPEAQAVFLSGTGMPTLPVLARLEGELRKPVISSNLAIMWHALRGAGVATKIPGYGRAADSRLEVVLAHDDAGVADAARDADRVEMLQHLDRQVAAYAGDVLVGHRRERTLRVEATGDLGQAGDGLRQEIAVRRDRRDPAEALDALEEPGHRLGL